MGAFFSSSRAPAEEEGTSLVLTFHNSSDWRSHFEANKSSKQLIVVDFSASWCGPCRIIEPFVKELANKFSDVKFLKIDVDELPDVSQEWGVQAMPTFVLIKEGKLVDKVVGPDKRELEKKVEKNRV
ncbi:hypothetical protein AMTRI_Chr03g147330 [Amborella trichopoda]